MADFVNFIPMPAALERGVVLAGDAAVVLAVSAPGAVGAGGEYLGLGVAAWFGLEVVGFQTIADLGTVFVGFGSDVAGQGPALVVAMTGGLDHARAVRYPVDLRAVGLRSIEVRWIQGVALDVWVDGVLLTPAADAGADLPVATHTGAMALGGTVGSNTAIMRAMSLHPAVVGTGWADDGDPVDGGMTGGLAFCTLQRSPGLPVVWMEFADSLDDAMGTLEPFHVGPGEVYAAAGTPEPEPPEPPVPPARPPFPLPDWRPEPGVPLLKRRVYRGNRFRLAFPVVAAEADTTLDGVSVRAQVRAAPGAELLTELSVSHSAIDGGRRFVVQGDSSAWPLGTVLCDVKISGPGIEEVLGFRVWVRVVA